MTKLGDNLFYWVHLLHLLTLHVTSHLGHLPQILQSFELWRRKSDTIRFVVSWRSSYQITETKRKWQSAKSSYVFKSRFQYHFIVSSTVTMSILSFIYYFVVWICKSVHFNLAVSCSITEILNFLIGVMYDDQVKMKSMENDTDLHFKIFQKLKIMHSDVLLVKIHFFHTS